MYIWYFDILSTRPSIIWCLESTPNNIEIFFLSKTKFKEVNQWIAIWMGQFWNFYLVKSHAQCMYSLYAYCHAPDWKRVKQNCHLTILECHSTICSLILWLPLYVDIILTNKWHQALLLVTGDIFSSGTFHFRQSCPRTTTSSPMMVSSKLAAMVLAPKFTEPGISTVYLRICSIILSIYFPTWSCYFQV